MSINLINIAHFALRSAFGRGSKMIRYYANRILAAMYQHCEFEPDRGKRKYLSAINLTQSMLDCMSRRYLIQWCRKKSLKIP